jgi:hypothetical protein
MKKEGKSQAALEFLTTYAWAFFGILVTLGALYYFGVFDFSKFLPQKCTFPSQFECIDFSFVGGEIRVKLVNNIGENVDVKDIVVTNDAASPLSCTLISPVISPGNPYVWDSGDEVDITFDTCTNDELFIEGSRTEVKMTMVYCSPATTGCTTGSTVDHSLSGKIEAVVN